MTDIQTLRHLVLARLGSPTPLLPGERYATDSPTLERTYDRYCDFLDECYGDEPGMSQAAVDRFVTELEAVRARDVAAFYYGRDLLLGELPVFVELPASDPEPSPVPTPDESAKPAPQQPRWSRKPRVDAPRLRQRVLDCLGRPSGVLPGESYVLGSSPELDRMRELIDRLEYGELSQRTVDEAIHILLDLRERDWEAFCFGRAELLSMLPIQLELSGLASRS